MINFLFSQVEHEKFKNLVARLIFSPQRSVLLLKKKLNIDTRKQKLTVLYDCNNQVNNFL